jgi:hypothetical protein
MKTGLVIEVTAYSPDYMLLDSPHCYSYENEKLKDIVAKVVSPYSDISIENDPRMKDEILYTVQYNETRYAFLSRLAYRYGEWLYDNGEKLVFGKMIKSKRVELVPGYDVLSYEYRLRLEHFKFSHAHHNYLSYENPKKDGLPLVKDKLHNMTDITFDQSKAVYKEGTFQHLKGSHP